MNFLFRGDRKYIQGADIYIFIENLIKKKTFSNLDLSFKGFLTTQPIIKINNIKSKTPNFSNNYIVSCIIEEKKNKTIINFKNSKKIISNSFSYDENIFYKYFSLSKNSIASCKMKTSFRDIEILVALTKFWHKKKVNKSGKWIFNRIKLIKNFENKYIKNIKIKNVSNKFNKYTVSSIFQNNKLIGEIHFSLK
jgi:hypothetical protein